ncbi:lysozyme inhibitor LprI family protein [Dyella sp. 20L07]|uniref:lysozyme inhibitor LprI family protein n=1 Tax=Dyella sp. 20L07 TaxID=3384240 RepID=UPI003D2CAF86
MRFALLASLLLIAVAFAAKADQPPVDREVEATFCANAKTQLDMTQCAGTAADAADRDLNATYQAVLKKWANFPGMIEKLRASQRAWLAYRDADIASRFANADAEGANRGTAYPAAYGFYRAGLERERTARLCEYLRGDAYGERDSAPCADLVRHPLIVPHAY